VTPAGDGMSSLHRCHPFFQRSANEIGNFHSATPQSSTAERHDLANRHVISYTT
jgi:hypothetical protein